MKALEATFGLVIVVGAAAGWHYWHIDALIAVVLGLGGLALINHAFTAEQAT